MRLKIIERYIIFVASFGILFIVGGIYYTSYILKNQLSPIPEDAGPFLMKYIGTEYYILIILLILGLIFIAIDNFRGILDRKRYIVIHSSILFVNIGFIMRMLISDGTNFFVYSYISYFELFRVYSSFHSHLFADMLTMVVVIYVLMIIVAFVFKKDEIEV